jgi:hypothetical protein
MIASSVRQFRVFVSSTFSDFHNERHALHTIVKPQLDQYCESRGCSFEFVDLRWGIGAQAAREHRTIELCLDEIARAHRLSPRPNFIALLGDRYGWRPLASSILTSEFDQLAVYLDASQREVFERLFSIDENAIPRHWALLPLPSGESAHDRERTESELRSALERAAVAARLPQSSIDHYGASATHREILAGSLTLAEDRRHRAYFYFRSIDVLPDSAASFRDQCWDGEPDRAATAKLAKLKAEIEEELGNNVRRYQSQ